jgi:hypothetical protein
MVASLRIAAKATAPPESFQTQLRLSHRLALAWRLSNRPPTFPPNDGDPDLESLVVRISDRAVLARSRGFYWDLGNRYPPRQYVRAAWSPNSGLLIRTTGRIGVPDMAELFAFTDDNSVIGPFET